MDSTYGALFIGVLVSAVLFGVITLQAFVYFQHYPADRWWTKLAVCWLCFLDAFHLSLSAHFAYYYIVVNYDNPSALLWLTWSYKLRSVVDWRSRKDSPEGIEDHPSGDSLLDIQ
ncbi:hypothetical protein V8D89_005357 [Ganoderma adspersum]